MEKRRSCLACLHAEPLRFGELAAREAPEMRCSLLVQAQTSPMNPHSSPHRTRAIAALCEELERAGEIRGVKIDYDIHSKVAALLKTEDADLLRRLVDLLFEKFYDPEPLSPKEKQAIAESEAELKKGDFITLEELESKLGL